MDTPLSPGVDERTPAASARQAATCWGVFIAAVFLVKVVLLLLDHRPMFFMGDSLAHINTALRGTIPPDRSFTYGYIIRVVALWTRSLGCLVAFQTLLSAITSILLAFILREYFRTSRNVAFTMGLLNAFEPLQLMYERYVLTEAVALFVFAVYVALAFRYMARKRLSTLLPLQVAAIALISLRFSFLPLAYVSAFAIPLLAAWDAGATTGWKKLRVVLLHVIVSVALLQCLTTGYKHLNANLSGRPPAIYHTGGHFLLAGFVPIVEPEDFPLPDLTDAVFGNVTYDLKDRAQRERHRWKPGGLILSIRKACPSIEHVNRVSKQTALNALKRDPMGVLRLTFLTYTDYFRIRYARKCMRLDRGLYNIPPSFLERLRIRFNYAYDGAPGIESRTLTGWLYFHAWPWYILLALIPIPAFIALFAGRRESLKYTFVLLLFILLILGPICLIGSRPVMRYLHPLAWTTFIIAGIFAERWTSCIRARAPSRP